MCVCVCVCVRPHLVSEPVLLGRLDGNLLGVGLQVRQHVLSTRGRHGNTRVQTTRPQFRPCASHRALCRVRDSAPSDLLRDATLGASSVEFFEEGKSEFGFPLVCGGSPSICEAGVHLLLEGHCASSVAKTNGTGRLNVATRQPPAQCVLRVSPGGTEFPGWK